MVIYRKVVILQLLLILYLGQGSFRRMADDPWWKLALSAILVVAGVIYTLPRIRERWDLDDVDDSFCIRKNNKVLFRGHPHEISSIHRDQGDYVLGFETGHPEIVIPKNTSNPAFARFLEKVKASGHATVASNI